MIRHRVMDDDILPAGHPNGKERQMRVRTAPDEYEAFERAAALSGVKLSTWVRQALREAAERRLSTAGERPGWI